MKTITLKIKFLLKQLSNILVSLSSTFENMNECKVFVDQNKKW